MMRIIILALIFLTAGIAYGQQTVIELRPVIRNEDTGKSLDGATIEVYKNGSLVAKETSGSNGKVPNIELDVCQGCTYKIFIKKAGFVTKMAIMDGHADYPEEMPPGTVEQRFEVSIFESVPDIDFSFLEKEPMVEFAIDPSGFIGFDQQKIKVMNKKITELRKKMEEKKEQLEKEAKEREKQEADFNAYIEAGDAAMKKTEYEKAIGQYELALKIRQDDQPTKDKIQDAKIKLEEMRAKETLEKDFSAKMTAGKTARSNDELEKALTLYKEASDLKPEEQLPKTYIAEIEKELADRKNNEAEFSKLVAAGDNAVGAENFDEGISKYEAALKLKKDDEVATKLEEAKRLKKEKEAALAAEKENQDKYNQLIAAADGAFDTENYDEAKKKYQEALQMKPGEARPTSQLAAIEEILKKQAADKAAKEKLEADYKQLMDEGKEKINQRSWDEAKAKYEKAIGLKPGDAAALAQLDLIAKEKEKAAGEEKLNAEYDAYMAEGKALFDQKKYAEAKSKYSAASDVKPAEQAPKDEISKIEGILADEKKAAELAAEYDKMISEGDAAVGRKDYPQALERYKKALVAKPGDAVAQSKIDEVNDAIAADAKLAEEKEKFDGFVATANQAFNAEDYDKAKLNYNNALDIKDDAEIREKIKQIDALIAKNQDAAETKAKYDAAIAEAEAAENANELTKAVEKYKAANSIQENDYPKGKIIELEEEIRRNAENDAKEKEFEELVSAAESAYASNNYSEALDKYKQAYKLKPKPEINDKIRDIGVQLEAENQNAEKQQRYEKKIEEADAAFEDENWDSARELYESAGSIKPSESYPGEQIEVIEARMKAESEGEAQRQYQKIIDKADALFDADNLDEANSYYERALGIKATDAYAQDRIDEIAKIKKDREALLADQKKLEEDYNALIREGEAAINTEKWQEALDKFNASLLLKPGEAYPLNKIAEIKSKLNDAELEKQKESEYLAMISQGDDAFNNENYQAAIDAYKEALLIKSQESYPKDRIAKAEEKLRQAASNEEEKIYQQLLSDAQQKYDAKDYEQALTLYREALNSKPTDPLPQSRIDEINQILLKAGEADKQEEKYDALIQKADNLFEKGDWSTAKENYVQAYNIFNRKWPEDRIQQCKDNMQAETDKTVNRNYDKIIKKADEYFKGADYEKAKEYYLRATGLKSQDQYPKDQLKAIEEILNPKAVVKTKTNLNNYGNPNRSTNSVDVANMLANAEAERKFISAQRTEQQGLNAQDSTLADGIAQREENFETREDVVAINEGLDGATIEPNEDLVVATKFVEDMVDTQVSVDRDRTEMNENDVQLQKQVVNNLVLEIDESTVSNDLPREGYLLDVEAIRSEIILENRLEDVAQTNETFDQKDYVTEGEEERINNNLNNDNPRLNTEVHVEDHQVDLINGTNTSTWDQEDVVMDVKGNTELIVDDIIYNQLQSDVPREIGEGRLEEAITAQNQVDKNRLDDQYDVTIDSKKYTESVRDEIEIENLNNDLPRERMEGFSEEQRTDMANVVDELILDQNNVLFSADVDLENMEVERVENSVQDDKDREGYEVVVDDLKEEKVDFLEDRTDESVDESHTTVDYLEGNRNEQDATTIALDEQADALIDNTSDAVDELKENNDAADAENEASLHKSEDYIESLRDIDIKKIDEQMKNALGDQFPEGMTEEIYTLDDEFGLMVSYVVRRVVVKNGAGNVYEMVRTKFGTVSYSCNGQAITEYEWEDKTDAADLVRN